MTPTEPPPTTAASLTPSVAAPRYPKRLLAALLVACASGGLLGGFAIAQLVAPAPAPENKVIVVRPPAILGCAPGDDDAPAGEATLRPLGTEAAPAARDDAKSATTSP